MKKEDKVKQLCERVRELEASSENKRKKGYGAGLPDCRISLSGGFRKKVCRSCPLLPISIGRCGSRCLEMDSLDTHDVPQDGGSFTG